MKITSVVSRPMEKENWKYVAQIEVNIVNSHSYFMQILQPFSPIPNSCDDVGAFPPSFHILSLSCEPFVNSDVMQKIIVRRINTSLIDINGWTFLLLYHFLIIYWTF